MVKLRLLKGDLLEKSDASNDVERKADSCQPVAYTNRMGRKYYLFRVETKNGKARYVFKKNKEGNGEPVKKIPKGLEVAENVNGIVSLRKAVKSPIRGEELSVVRSILNKHDHLARYRVEAVRGDIVVFEPTGGVTPELMKMQGRLNPLSSMPNLDLLERSVQYLPVLRFRLLDKMKRNFYTERMTYRGEGGMMPLMGGSGTIHEVAKRFCPKLGRNSFFELF